MTSRLSLSAAVFAVLATATLAYAAEGQPQRAESAKGVAAASTVIVLPKVVVTGQNFRH